MGLKRPDSKCTAAVATVLLGSTLAFAPSCGETKAPPAPTKAAAQTTGCSSSGKSGKASSTDKTEEGTELRLKAEDVTYKGKVKKILDDNCISCHPKTDKKAPMSDYATAKKSAAKDSFLERIQLAVDEEGFMPKGGDKLERADIDALKKWVEGDLPEGKTVSDEKSESDDAKEEAVKQDEKKEDEKNDDC